MKNIIIDNKSSLTKLFHAEGRHLHILKNTGKLLVVGDLHGDCRMLDLLLNKFFLKNNEYSLIFLGDYVDREPDSWIGRESAVIDRLLSFKLQYPNRIFLLMGNHDLNPAKFFSFYSTFWNHLESEQVDFYSDVLSAMPVVATTHNGVALCHGTLPLSPDFKSFKLHSNEFLNTVWADYYEREADTSRTCRPIRTKEHFKLSMEAFKCSVLIKGHNPLCPLRMFNDRCVTVQSNRYYKDHCGMHVVIVDLEKSEINSAKDGVIREISSLK